MHNLEGEDLLTAIYLRPADVIGRPIANKERINGASLKAAGSLAWTQLNYSHTGICLNWGK